MEGKLNREVVLVLVAAAISIVVGIGSSYVTTYARMAVLENTMTGVVDKLSSNQTATRRELDAALARDNAQSLNIQAMVNTVQRIDMAVARIEAKMEK